MGLFLAKEQRPPVTQVRSHYALITLCFEITNMGFSSERQGCRSSELRKPRTHSARSFHYLLTRVAELALNG